MAVENMEIVPIKDLIADNLKRFIPAILASAQAVEANITGLGFRVKKSLFSAQSPTAKISGFSVRI